MADVSYQATPILAQFFHSPAFVRGVMGPVGSGKSTAMCMELLRRAREQTAGRDGVRRTKFAVIRNTYRELCDTSLRTWLDWFPEGPWGRFNKNEMTYFVRFGDVDSQVLFRALDRPQDIKKLLSLELTGAWVNEARELPKCIIDTLAERVGRYPSRRDCPPELRSLVEQGKASWPAWYGIVMDTNPPDTDHWWYNLAEVLRPEGWAFFRQPGGLVRQGDGFAPNPLAENLENLPPDYYVRASSGQSRDHVLVYHCAEYGFVLEGRPVYPEYVDSLHCAPAELEPTPGLPLTIGLDFGLTPAALIAQRQANGRWLWLDELVATDMGVQKFGRELRDMLHAAYPGLAVDVWGDPAGVARSQTDEKTAFQILNALGIPARPAPSNNFTLRREAVAAPLSRLVDGKPGLIVSPRCKVLRKAMAGAYCLRRLAVAGEERFADAPDKNEFSHVAEAGQYAMLGAGEGRALTRPRDAQAGPRQTHATFNFRFTSDCAGGRQARAL